MKYIALPDKAVRHLSFYLAMEEYIAHNRPGEDCFFMWQVNPTVIFGRNQLMENEINFDYVRSHGIEYYRRKSGGGCVYADFSNIMFSYITDDFNVSFTFDRYLQLIAHTLNKLGVKAVASGRNDIIGKCVLSHIWQKYRPRYYALRYQPRRFGSIHYPQQRETHY